MTATVNANRTDCIDTIAKASHLRCFEMDKAAESAMLQAFNSLVPRGTYLADYLDGAAEAFESAIRSDIVMPFSSSIRENRRELDEATQELAAMKQKIKDEEAKLRKVQQEVNYAKRQAAELAESVKGIDDSLNAIRRVAREINAK